MQKKIVIVMIQMIICVVALGGIFEIRPHKFDMKKVKFGMTWEEVAGIEGYKSPSFTREEYRSMPLGNKTFYGVPASVYYDFWQKRLVRVTYIISYGIPSTYKKRFLESQGITKDHTSRKKYPRLYLETPELCKRDFQRINEGLESDFGPPTKKRIRWNGNKNYGDPFKVKDIQIFLNVSILYIWDLPDGSRIEHLMKGFNPPSSGGYTPSGVLDHWVFFKSKLEVYPEKIHNKE